MILLIIALIVISGSFAAIMINPTKFLFDAEFKTQLDEKELEKYEIK